MSRLLSAQIAFPSYLENPSSPFDVQLTVSLTSPFLTWSDFHPLDSYCQEAGIPIFSVSPEPGHVCHMINDVCARETDNQNQNSLQWDLFFSLPFSYNAVLVIQAWLTCAYCPAEVWEQQGGSSVYWQKIKQIQLAQVLWGKSLTFHFPLWTATYLWNKDEVRASARPQSKGSKTAVFSNCFCLPEGSAF